MELRTQSERFFCDSIKPKNVFAKNSCQVASIPFHFSGARRYIETWALRATRVHAESEVNASRSFAVSHRLLTPHNASFRFRFLSRHGELRQLHTSQEHNIQFQTLQDDTRARAKQGVWSHPNASYAKVFFSLSVSREHVPHEILKFQNTISVTVKCDTKNFHFTVLRDKVAQRTFFLLPSFEEENLCTFDLCSKFSRSVETKHVELFMRSIVIFHVARISEARA